MLSSSINTRTPSISTTWNQSINYCNIRLIPNVKLQCFFGKKHKYTWNSIICSCRFHVSAVISTGCNIPSFGIKYFAKTKTHYKSTYNHYHVITRAVERLFKLSINCHFKSICSSRWRSMYSNDSMLFLHWPRNLFIPSFYRCQWGWYQMPSAYYVSHGFPQNPAAFT